jgi:serine/threonine-protein kinase OSR1/STK39
MITECLQKDPAKRPTANELLKHPFFKKAKDKKFLTATLLPTGPSMKTRVNKASKRQPGASGRLHRTTSGDWVWSSEDEGDNDGKNNSSDSESEGKPKPLNQIERADSSDEEHEESEQSSGTTTDPTAAVAPTLDIAKLKIVDEEQNRVVNLVLRMRNANRELNDIRFEFVVGKDSAEGISLELVGAGLVDNNDTVVMTSNLQKLIDQRHTLKSVTFQLKSSGGEVPDEKSLIGFAQISITD